MLELHRVVKHYSTADGDPIRAIDGVSLKVDAGELVALSGRSGSGKTTLLNLVAGLQQPDSGRVTVDGIDIRTLSPRAGDLYRRTQLGIIGQPHNLFPGARAIENASLKLWLTNARHANAIIEPLLARLGLSDRLLHRTEQLSMGERQRVLIARAIVTKPKLVLADEPTASLDSERGAEVLNLLHRHCEDHGTAMLIATHDPEAIVVADRACELRDGRLRDHSPRTCPAPGAAPAALP